MQKLKRNKKGFTLIELIVVVAIIAILAAVAVPNFMSLKAQASKAAAQNDASMIISALNIHNALESTQLTLDDVNGTSKWTTLAEMTADLDTLAPSMSLAQMTAALSHIGMDPTSKFFILVP